MTCTHLSKLLYHIYTSLNFFMDQLDTINNLLVKL